MTVNFVPFMASHAYEMEWIEPETFGFQISQDPSFFINLERAGGSTTLLGDGKILGIINAFEVHPKSCYLNMFMSKEIQKCFNKTIFKALRNFVIKQTKRYPRVSVEGKTSNTKLIKLCKHLGFKEEGIMKKFGFNSEDYTLFAIVGDE